MAKNQELELSILIGGHVDNSLAQAVKLANTQIGSVANGASKFAANIAKGAVAAAGGVAAGVVNTTKEAVAFESEMLDVTKYVSGLTDDNGKVVKENYDEMSKGILDLSTQIPYTAEELTRLAAAAGQSGKNMDDLLGKEQFLKDVAEMGTAMDISADQAGDWAAKWEVAFDTDHEGVMKLADQINYLGAHYATTAAEIAQTVNDTGSLGMIAGMDTDQTAALSTALLAMGVNSNTVATSIRRMYTNLTMGSKATRAQHEAFEELGFSATQFAKDMQKVDANSKSLAPEALKRLFTAIGQQDEDLHDALDQVVQRRGLRVKQPGDKRRQQQKQRDRHTERQDDGDPDHHALELLLGDVRLEPAVELRRLRLLQLGEVVRREHERLDAADHRVHKRDRTADDRPAEDGVLVLDEVQFLHLAHQPLRRAHNDGLLFRPAHEDALDKRLTADGGAELSTRPFFFHGIVLSQIG